jgi:hypothetical protein
MTYILNKVLHFSLMMSQDSVLVINLSLLFPPLSIVNFFSLMEIINMHVFSIWLAQMQYCFVRSFTSGRTPFACIGRSAHSTRHTQIHAAEKKFLNSVLESKEDGSGITVKRRTKTFTTFVIVAIHKHPKSEG